MNPFNDYMHPYSLCNDTLTVYHMEGGHVSRNVYTQAYFENERAEDADKLGSERKNTALAVIPGSERACEVGDRILLGEGPDVPDDAMAWWRAFIPPRVANLFVVKRVSAERFGGGVCHTEARG